MEYFPGGTEEVEDNVSLIVRTDHRHSREYEIWFRKQRPMHRQFWWVAVFMCSDSFYAGHFTMSFEKTNLTLGKATA